MVLFLQKNVISNNSEKVPLLKKQDAFFPENKKPAGTCTRHGGLVLGNTQERPLKYCGDSLKYYPIYQNMVPFLQKTTISEKVQLLKQQDTFFPGKKAPAGTCTRHGGLVLGNTQGRDP